MYLEVVKAAGSLAISAEPASEEFLKFWPGNSDKEFRLDGNSDPIAST
jgi:hypothetical protein